MTEGVEQLRKIGLHLEGIRDKLLVHSLAKVQGWEGKGYGFHIHNMIQTKIRAHSHSESEHRFYVYNPDTSWHSNFKEILENQPLPDSYGGYSADLDAIFLLMWTNRRTSVETAESGADVIFHLLVPTYQAYAIDDRLVVGEGLAPLIIKGHRHNGENLAFFRFIHLPQNVTLQNVGNLHALSLPVRIKSVRIKRAIILLMLSLGTIMAFPLFPYSMIPIISGVAGGMVVHMCKTKKPDRVLGPPMFLNPRVQSTT